MSQFAANVEFEHPSPSMIETIKDEELIGYAKCVRREITAVRSHQDWDAQGVKIGEVYGVVDVTDICRYSMGDTPDCPTSMYRIRTGTTSGTWWLPAVCFELLSGGTKAISSEDDMARKIPYREPNPQDPGPNILEEANQIIHGARRKDYGTPLHNHSCTADLWNRYINQRFGSDVKLTAEDICFLNCLQKIGRVATTGSVTRDAIVDIAGYAGNIEMIQDERKQQP